MSEQEKMDRERAAFEAWLSSLKFVSGQGPEHVAYCLHRDLNDQYTTEWVHDMYRGWQARASLPVGVPDAEALLTRLAEWCDKQPKQPWYGRTAGDMVRTFMACQPLDAPAAQPASEQSPTDKQSLTVADQSAPDHAEDALEMVEQSAPGEVEEVEVVCVAVLGGIFHGGSGPELGDIDLEPDMKKLERIQCQLVGSSDDATVDLMTVAQHKRIVAQLAARDAGVVRVPVEFVRFLLGITELRGCAFGEKPVGERGNFWWRDELRALLAQRERGSDDASR